MTKQRPFTGITDFFGWPLPTMSEKTFYCIQQKQGVKLTTSSGSMEINLFDKMNVL